MEEPIARIHDVEVRGDAYRAVRPQGSVGVNPGEGDAEGRDHVYALLGDDDRRVVHRRRNAQEEEEDRNRPEKGPRSPLNPCDRIGGAKPLHVPPGSRWPSGTGSGETAVTAIGGSTKRPS